MKKIIILLAVTLCVGALFADIMQPAPTKIAREDAIGKIPERNNRPVVPNYEFVTDPTDLITNYYDYMPGSYNGLPVQVQPEVSQPFGYTADGVYMIFHGQETSAANRREYYSYVDAAGTVSPPAPVGNNNIWEGYGGIAIDPITADPFATWHQQEGSGYDAIASYDLFHMLGAPGLWRETFVVIDNPVTIMNPDDEFIWPYIYIGPSPLGEDHRRAYVIGNNSADNTPSSNPSENKYIGYADFTTADLDAQSALDWTYFTIPLMDQWHNEAPWTRPFSGTCVSDDGQVAIMGYVVGDSEEYNDKSFVFYNNNYGEGEFTYYDADYRLWVDNPQNQDGSYAFENDNGNPYNTYFAFTNSGHMNVIFSDDGSKILFNGALGLNGEDPDGGDGVYWPYCIFPYFIEYDIASNEFHHQILGPEINPNAADPNYVWGRDIAYLPWDTDNDGNIDEYDEDGNVLWYSGWPIWFYDNDVAFHENNFKLISNGNYLVATWQDGLYNKYANAGVEGYEEWLEAPEICFCVSSDGGATWSDVLFLNALDTPELADMIPVYVYPGNKIVDIAQDTDNYWGTVHLMFMADNSFGSSIQGFGLANGGMMKYAALRIEFPEGEPPQPNLVYNPDSFDVEMALDQVAIEELSLSNNGGGTINYTIALDPVVDWLTIDPEAGDITTETDIIELTFDTNGMEIGEYSCDIVITDNREETTIPVTLTTLVSADDELLSKATALIGNYPNPFISSTTISYNIREKGNVKVDVYNAAGQKVRTLVDENKAPDTYDVTWDGKDDAGHDAATGIYFYKLKHGGRYTSTKKMILMK